MMKMLNYQQLLNKEECVLDSSYQIRNDQGKLCGYATEENGKKYLALYDEKDRFLGKIEADDLYYRLMNGPCFVVECHS